MLLKWLVSKFESDRPYPEKELNEVLKHDRADTATLRREFIGYNLMARDRAIYRRLPETEWLEETSNFN